MGWDGWRERCLVLSAGSSVNSLDSVFVVGLWQGNKVFQCVNLSRDAPRWVILRNSVPRKLKRFFEHTLNVDVTAIICCLRCFDTVGSLAGRAFGL